MRSVPVGISPRIDAVFKAIFGDVRHKQVLLDFLRAILPEHNIADVHIENPFTVAEFLDEKISVLDIRATDADGHIFQIEMQGYNEPALRKRLVYSAAHVFSQQLSAGQEYDELRQVISIWVMDINIFRDHTVHHRFSMRDPSTRLQLSDCIEIHTIELEKWRRHGGNLSPALKRWLRFLTEADHWISVPDELRTPAMELAMEVLENIDENTQLNHAYRARMEGLRRQRTQQAAMERALRGKEEAELQLQEARQELEYAKERRARVEQERAQAEQELAQAEQERAQAEQERARAEQERAQAEQERAQAEQERERAEQAMQQAREGRERAEQARERLRQMLRAAGIDPGDQ